MRGAKLTNSRLENREPFQFIPAVPVHSSRKDNMTVCINIIQNVIMSSRNSNSRICNLKKWLDFRWLKMYVMG